MCQCFFGLCNCIHIFSHYTARQSVFRSGIHEFKRCFPVFWIIEVNSQYRAEYFLAHGSKLRVVCYDSSGFDEISFCIIITTAGDNLRIVSCFSIIDEFRNGIKSRLIDNRIHEIRKIFRIAHFDGIDFCRIFIFDLFPDRSGNIGP